MKKLLAILICAVMCVALLTSCDIFKHEHAKSDWKHNESEHWRVPECERSDCAVEQEVYDLDKHSDENTDGICDVCGYQMSVRPIEWQYSDTHHWHMPEGNFVEGVILGYGEHIDDDNNRFCDVCEYQMPEFPSPTNHFLRNQAGCEWLHEITAEDIAEVKIITEAVGAAPGAFKNISTTIDEAVIARIFEDYYWLDTSPISKENGTIDGGGAVTVKFILKDGTEKELYINNGNYRDTNKNYFELLYTPKFEDTEDYVKSYGFITYQGHGTVYDGNDNPICSIPMNEIEFAEVTDEIALDTKPITHYVETEFGKIYFLSEIYFYIEGIVKGDPWIGEKHVYYQLYSKALDELICEYIVVPE